MATPHANLPRGTRIKVGTTGSLKQILFGPAEVDDGSQNLIGAITTCMGNVGARTIAELQQTEAAIGNANARSQYNFAISTIHFQTGVQP